MSAAIISRAKFAGAKMMGVISAYEVGTPASLPEHWLLAKGNFEGSVVEYLVGPGASIGGAEMAGLALVKLNLSGIYMPGSHLVGASFAGTKILKGDLASSDLEEVDFTGANMSGSNFTDADFEGANFTNANFTNANLSGARLLSVSGTSSAKFAGAICPDGISYSSLGSNC